jgi:hypothetical protein
LQLEGPSEDADDVGVLAQDVAVRQPDDRVVHDQMEEPAGFVVNYDNAALAVDGQQAIPHISHHMAEKHVLLPGSFHGSLCHQHCCRAGLSKAHAPDRTAT